MTELEFKEHMAKLDAEIAKYYIDLSPEKLLGPQFDATLDAFIAHPEPETVLGPNVLSFDQNKRRRAINHRIYQNDAQLIELRRK